MDVFYLPVDFNHNDTFNFRSENVISLPTLGAGDAGRLVFHTVDNKPYMWTGSTWLDLTAGGGGGSQDFQSVIGFGDTATGAGGTVTFNVTTGEYLISSSNAGGVLGLSTAASAHGLTWTGSDGLGKLFSISVGPSNVQIAATDTGAGAAIQLSSVNGAEFGYVNGVNGASIVVNNATTSNTRYLFNVPTGTGPGTDFVVPLSVNGVNADSDGEITIPTGDYSEWASYSGVRASGTLVTLLGDYDAAGNGTLITIDDANEQIEFSKDLVIPEGVVIGLDDANIVKTAGNELHIDYTNIVKIGDVDGALKLTINPGTGNVDIDGLLSITGTTATAWFSANGITADRFYGLPDNTGTLALLSDIPPAGGDVFKSGTPVDNQIAVWIDNETVEGTVNFTFNDAAALIGIGQENTKAGSIYVYGNGSGPSLGGAMRVINALDYQADQPFYEIAAVAGNMLLRGSGATYKTIIASTGQFQFNQYGSGTHTGTLAYVLGVTAAGNLIETTIGAEVNDLTAAVTWANIPDANVPQSAVTQHQAALSITESQISDLQAYLTNITGESLSSLSDVTITAIASNEILKWSGTAWINNTLAEAGISAVGHTHTASEVTDFDTEVSNNASVTANTAKVSFPGFTSLAADYGYSEPTHSWAEITGKPTTLAGFGISDTKANFNTALSDGSFMFIGDAPTAHTHVVADITDFAAGVSANETSHADVLVDGDFISQGLMKRGLGVGSYSIVTDNSDDWNTAFGWGDHSVQGYLTSYTETNDLSAAVTWVNVPDANITQTSVTQHQAALSITESQISDLGAYITGVDLGYTASTRTVTNTQGTNAVIPLFNTANTEAGLVPGSNGGAATLYLDATGNWSTPAGGGGSTDLKPYCATGSGSQVQAAATQVAISTVQVSDANYSLSSNEITVTDAGTYQISYAIQVDEDSTGGGTRGRVTAYVEDDGVAIVQSYNSVYTREASGGTGLSNTFIVTLGASSVIDLWTDQDGNGTPDLSVERAQISIIKVG